MCAHVVTYNPMAELNPVSDTHALLESMLQKLRLNAENNSSSLAAMQTCCPSRTVEDSSKPIYQFGFSSKNKEQDGSASVWNNWENSWTQQSSHFGGALTPKQPVKRISKHNTGFSTKPKRPPLIFREHKRFTPERTDDVTSWVGDDQMPRPEKMQQFSLDGEASSNVPPLYKTDSFLNPPDLLAPTLKSSSSSVVEKTEVTGQSGTWSWVAVNENIEGIRPHEQSGKTTKTSRKKWGEAKRWAQNVKERWRERHRSTLTRQSDDGERPAQNEVQSNLSPLSGLINVNNTPTAPAETTDIHHEPINTALDEDGPASLSNMSDSLLSFGNTSNLMEEIFSGTEWAQFLSVNQSNEPQSNINQSREEERHSKLAHSNTTNSHLGMTKPSLSESFASDIPVYNQTETSRMSVPSSHVTELTTNTLQTSDPFTNELQNGNLKPNKSHHSEQSNEQSQFSQLDPNESKATGHNDPQLMSSQVSDPSQGGTEDFIPLLDLSYIKPMDRSSIKSQGSLSRKREHWTKRSNPFEHTTQDMEAEDHSSSRVAAGISPTPPLNSLMDTTSESSVSPETAVKKRRMEDTRRVRFSEEVIILPPSYLPEYDDEDEDEDDNQCPEEPSPRPSYPKWIVSLKSKSAKYKF